MAVLAAEGVHLEELPGEVLAHIFGLLSPKELLDVETVSRRCRAVVVQHELWRRQCVRAHPAMTAATAAIDASRVPSHRATAAGSGTTAAAGAAEPPPPAGPQQRLAGLQQRLAELVQQQGQYLSQQERQQLVELQQQAAEERRHAEAQELVQQGLQQQMAEQQQLVELQQHLAEPQHQQRLADMLHRLAEMQQQLAELQRLLRLPHVPEQPASPLQQPPPQQQERCSAFFKRLHVRLTAPPAKESLVAEGLASSSTDHPEEGVHNVLTPTSRSRNLMCYWSSRGSEDKSGCEALALRLAHPLCVVTEVQLRPFRAWFQEGAPVYAPRAVRFHIGALPCFDRSGVPLDGSPTHAAALAAAVQRDLTQAVASAQVQERQWAQRDRQMEQREVQRRQLLLHGQEQPPPDAQGQHHAMQTLLMHLQHAVVQNPEAPGPRGALEALRVLLGEQLEAELLAEQGLPPQAQPRGDGGWEWTSPIYAVGATDTLQRFVLPSPVLCVGGYLRIELLGKSARQAADEAFYTCICHARAVGTPIHNFALLPAGGAAAQQGGGAAGGGGRRLTYLDPDPLLAAGGLRALSEGGRLAALGDGGSEEEEGSSDDDDSMGDDFLPELVMEEEGEEGASSGSDSGTDGDEWQPGGDAGAY